MDKQNGDPSEKLPVKIGLITLDTRMTRAQVERYGKRHMPQDLKRAGFECFVGRYDAEYWQGVPGVWFRINYGKK